MWDNPGATVTVSMAEDTSFLCDELVFVGMLGPNASKSSGLPCLDGSGDDCGCGLLCSRAGF